MGTGATAGALIACLVLWVSSASADEAEQMYKPGTVDVIELTLSPKAIGELEAEPFEYVAGEFSLAQTDGTPGGVGPFTTPQKAEIRLKGSLVGSFENLSAKAGFKIKFKKSEKFLGLRKMTLNSMVQDPSMIHETLAYRALAAAGVAASHTGYAYLRVNGEGYGVYLNIEPLDVVALEKRFGAFKEPPQHLYEGEYGEDLFPGSAGGFEIDEGAEGERADLEALVQAVNYKGPEPWSTHIAPYADLEQMTRLWATEKYIGQWDGYAGVAAPARPNNYYLYSDPSGRFQMFPWGTDQTWVLSIVFDGKDGLMFNICLEEPTCRRLYLRELQSVTAALGADDLDGLAGTTAALLAPWQALETPPRRPADATEIAKAVAATRTFVAGRQAEAVAFLKVNEEAKEESIAAPLAPPVPPAPTPEVGALLLGRVERSGRYLAAAVTAPTAGSVRLSATMRSESGGGWVRACEAQAAAQAPGPLAIRCRLSAAARCRLARHALVLRLSAELAGGSDSLRRRVRLPRG